MIILLAIQKLTTYVAILNAVGDALLSFGFRKCPKNGGIVGRKSAENWQIIGGYSQDIRKKKFILT